MSSFDDPEISRPEVRVLFDGTVSLPLIENVDVGGTTRSEAEALLREAYEEVFRDPQLSLTVNNALGSHFYVMGDVLRQSRYPYDGPVTVLEAITLAGGLRVTQRAGGESFAASQGSLTKAFLIRRSAGTWNSAYAVGKQVFIEGSQAGNSGPYMIIGVSGATLTLENTDGANVSFTGETQSVTVTITLTDDERVTLAAAERNDVTYLSHAAVDVIANFDATANTITRTSGPVFTGVITAGDYIQVLGVSGNATEGQAFYQAAEVGQGGNFFILELVSGIGAPRGGNK